MLIFCLFAVIFAETTSPTKPKQKAFWEDWEPDNKESSNNTNSIVPDKSDNKIDKGNCKSTKKMILTFRLNPTEAQNIIENIIRVRKLSMSMNKLLGDDLRDTLYRWVMESYKRGNSNFQQHVEKVREDKKINELYNRVLKCKFKGVLTSRSDSGLTCESTS